MADLSIFKLDNQTITIKDTTARQAAESAKTLATTASGNATTALNKINELESEKADTIISSASGAIASFPDGAARPVDDLTVQIEPVQDLHGYDSPWPAGGGVNQFAIADAVGVLSSSGATYGLTITLDNTAETIRIHGTPNWSDTSASVTFRCISTAKGSYYGDAPVTHDYSGMAYKIFPISLSPNVSSIYALGISSGMITVSLSKTGNAEIDVLFKIVIATAGTTIGVWTPYSNICPITGWTGAKVTRTGKNLLQPKFYGNVVYNQAVGSSILISGDELTDITNTVAVSGDKYTKTGGAWDLEMSMMLDVSSLIGQQLRFSGQFVGDLNNSNGLRSAWFFTDANYIVTRKSDAMNLDPQWVLTPQDGEKYLIWMINAAAAGTIELNQPMAELGSTATAYEPYQSTTYDITFPTEAGTVYGGTLDVTSGVLTVDMAMVDLGTLTWNLTYGRFNAPLPSIKPASNQSAKPNVICSAYPTITPNEWYAKTIGVTSLITGYIGNGYVGLVDSAYPDASSLQNALLGVQLVYELATPITYQLTASQITTLLGQNNIWADAGDTSVTYKADTKLYIDNKFTELQALILENLERRNRS